MKFSEFIKELEKNFYSFEMLSTFSLQYLQQLLDVETIGIFLALPENKDVWRLREVIHLGRFIEGEEEIDLRESVNSQLLKLRNREKKYYFKTYGDKFCFYSPLGNEEVIGCLRFVDDKRKKKSFFSKLSEIEALGYIIASYINRLFLWEEVQVGSKMLNNFMSLSTILAREKYLKGILKEIISELEKSFRFDFIRVYLINKDEKSIFGFIGIDWKEKVFDLTYLKVFLNEERIRLSEFVKSKKDIEVYDNGCSVYLSLKSRGEVFGILEVSNIYSQKRVRENIINFLKAFLNHVNLAIEKAALFEEIEKLSLKDGLTGLYNIRYFKERVEEEIRRAKRNNLCFSIIMIDLDNFKKINDTFGHVAGDKVLKQFSEGLQKNMRKGDVICRYGGDEFLILLPGIDMRKSEFTKDIVKRVLSQKVKAGDSNVEISASLGGSVYPFDAKEVEELFEKADVAMYEIKKSGKAGFKVYKEAKKYKKKQFNTFTKRR